MHFQALWRIVVTGRAPIRLLAGFLGGELLMLPFLEGDSTFCATLYLSLTHSTFMSTKLHIHRSIEKRASNACNGTATYSDRIEIHFA